MFKTFDQVEAFFNQRRRIGIKPGLERIEQLLKCCDHPEQKIDSIHIAGTNGKGSTIRYMEEALYKNGFQVGVFTSPSLKGLRGYMKINGELISEKQFMTLLNELYPNISLLDEQKSHPTEFEIITVLAFMFFQTYADISLIETGMGGRNDTTNCIDPLLSIITNVEYDHTQFLGDTIEKIAYEKAGIIKEQRPVIIGEISPRARAEIVMAAKQSHSPIYELNNEFSYGEYTKSNDTQQFSWQYGLEKHYLTIHPKGIHQVRNCSIALMALTLLKDYGYKLKSKNIISGIKTTKIPGRFEQIKTKPSVIIDGAHNVAGIKAFLHTVETYYQNVNKTLVFAAFKDKDVDSMLSELIPYFTKVILTTFDHPRAATEADLKEWTSRYEQGIEIIHLEDFLRIFKSEQKIEKDNYYFITGSLSFIKVIKKSFETNQNL